MGGFILKKSNALTNIPGSIFSFTKAFTILGSSISDIEFNLAVKSETTTEKVTKKSSTKSMKTEVKDEDPDQKDTKADAPELDTSDEDESKVENQEKEKDE